MWGSVSSMSAWKTLALTSLSPPPSPPASEAIRDAGAGCAGLLRPDPDGGVHDPGALGTLRGRSDRFRC